MNQDSTRREEETQVPSSLTALYAQHAGISAPAQVTGDAFPQSLSPSPGPRSLPEELPYRDDPELSKMEGVVLTTAVEAVAVETATEESGFISDNTDTGNQNKGQSSLFSSLSKVASSAKAFASRIKNSSTAPSSSHFNPRAPISLSALSNEQRVIVSSLNLEDEIQWFIDRFIDMSDSRDGLMGSHVKLERFVIHMIQRGYDPLWADASFRTFDVNADGEVDSVSPSSH